MTDDFDGYRKWLNITIPRRPPSHYDLLGIKLDEDDHEVIQAAIEQRRNYVESKRGHGKDDLVAEILMRIDEAGITLLNSEMRRDYDRQMELFEKRRKKRRVDPNSASTRFESRPGRVVGEDGGIVKTFAGIMAIVCIGFGIMAWFSFQLPWNKPAKDTGVAQAPTPQPIVVQIQQSSVPVLPQQSNPPVEQQPEKPVTTTNQATNSPNENLEGATVFKGHSYKVYREALDWKTAKGRCEAMGGHLVTVADQAENGFITALATKVIGDINNTGIWLGATDERTEGKWEWVDGTPFVYSDWSKDQPNNKGGVEHFCFLLLYFRGPAGNEFRGWCDQPNDSKQHVAYFACEWDSTTDQQIVEQSRPTENPKQVSEPFRQGSIWGGGGTLTVIDRQGETFSARFETDEWARIIKGTIKNNQVTWLAKDVQPIKGTAGGDNYGRISSDQDGYKMEVEWRQPNGKSGKFTIRLINGDSVAANSNINAESPNSSKEVSLLDGNSLEGWQAPNKGEVISNWTVTDGVLRLKTTGPSLRTKQIYRDCDLHLEFKLPPKCNSGVFLRGRYEVQLLDSQWRRPNGAKEIPSGSCGSIYGQVAPSKDVYRGPDQWNTLDVRLIGNAVTVRMNDVMIIDSFTLRGPTPGKLDENESDPGPIVLQAHTTFGQEFRNITIKPIP